MNETFHTVVVCDLPFPSVRFSIYLILLAFVTDLQRPAQRCCVVDWRLLLPSYCV